MSDPFHWPPDLLELLIDTIPHLVKGNAALLEFLQGAGIPEAILQPHRQQLIKNKDDFKKPLVVRAVLNAVNVMGDSGLAPRRQVLDRVVRFEDFSTCYDNVRDQTELGVRKIRDLVQGKDYVTQIRQEHTREAEVRRAGQRERVQAAAEQSKQREEIRQGFAALFIMTDVHARGRAFEALLNRLFAAHHILVSESFVIRADHGVPTEQIDGVINHDNMLWLVEAKWWTEGVDAPSVQQHCYRMFNRTGLGGIFISGTGFKRSAVAVAQEHISHRPLVLITLFELWSVIDAKGDLASFLLERIRGARLRKSAFAGPHLDG